MINDENDKSFLEQHLSMLKQSLDALPDLAVIVDKDCNIIYCNWKGIGNVKNKIIGSKCHLTLRDRTEICPDCCMSKIIELKKPINFTIHDADDNIVDITIAPIFDYKGNVVYIFEHIKDVSHVQKLNEDLETAFQKEVELKEKFKESEEKLKSIFRAVPTGIGVLVNRKIIFVNEKLIEISGYAEDELVGKETKEFYPSVDEYEKILEVGYKKLNQNATATIETRLTRKDGKILNILLNITPLKLDKIEDGILITVLDITKRKQAEIALKESETKYRSMMEAMDDMVYICDKNFIIEYMNPKAIEYVGDDFIGEVCYEVFSMFFDLCEICKNSASNHNKFFKTEFFNSIDSKHFLVSFIPIYHEDNSFSRMVIMRDITEQKQKEEERKNLIIKLEKSFEKEQASYEQLEEAYAELEETKDELSETNIELEEALVKADESNRLKTEFLAIMSHELRTPLAGMLGFSQLLYSDEELNENQKEHAYYLYQSSKRLLNVLTDIIEISILEAGKFEIELMEFDINDILEDVYVLYENSFIQKDITFIKETNGITYIKSDKRRIRQILLNLVANAVKFTESGEIRVSLKMTEDNESIVFTVCDTGIGISENEKTSIFKMFKQVEGDYKRSYEGTGLGLTICKKLVNALGGEIWVKSKINRGSTFYFSIPKFDTIFDEPKLNLTEKSKDINIGKENNMKVKVLFGEDDEVNHKFMTNVLGKTGEYQYKGCFNGQEVINELKENKDYDIVLLDIQMPVMDGIRCLQEIREISENIPVVAITAYAMKYDKERYMAIGFDDYISKPFNKQKLYELIQSNVQN